MAQAHDRIRFVIQFPATNIEAHRQAIVIALSDHGGTVGVMRTGWAQAGTAIAPISITALEIEFTTPKNSMTDAEIVALANEIATIVGQPLLTVGKQDMENLL